MISQVAGNNTRRSYAQEVTEKVDIDKNVDEEVQVNKVFSCFKVKNYDDVKDLVWARARLICERLGVTAKMKGKREPCWKRQVEGVNAKIQKNLNKKLKEKLNGKIEVKKEVHGKVHVSIHTCTNYYFRCTKCEVHNRVRKHVIRCRKKRLPRYLIPETLAVWVKK